jgi:uncharacterized membrane protein YgcG
MQLKYSLVSPKTNTTQKVKETKKSHPEPLKFNKPQKTPPSLQQEQHDHLWIESCTPEMAHMPAACVFTMASSKEIQREVKILLQQQATTRTNVHNLQESNTKKIPLQQKMKKKKRKKRQSRGGKEGGGGGGGGGGGYWYSLKISLVKRT